ncbi:MAG: hypothetical protein J6Y20_03690 [Lachnospiraceae bacterium]|nr:hypothetical protein [Lachnospiraceae bacterium]
MTNEQLYLAEKVTDYIRENDYLSGRDMRTLAQLRESAVCTDSPIGGYKCYVEIVESRGPGHEPTVICVDTCLQHEIYELRKIHNVNTIGCCCGHGRKQAYIQVSPQFVQKMHELGYEQLPEQEDGQGKWCFKPKTFFLQPVSNSYKFEVNDLVNRFTLPDWRQFENNPPNYCGAEMREPPKEETE